MATKSSQPRYRTDWKRRLRRRPMLLPSFEPLEARQLMSIASHPEQASLFLRASRKPAITVSIDPADDPDHDGIVAQSHLVLEGKTRPRAKVRLDLGANGSFEQKTKADKKGNYHFVIDVVAGATPIRVQLVGGPEDAQRRSSP